MFSRKRICEALFVCALSCLASCEKPVKIIQPFNQGYWHQVGKGRLVGPGREGASVFVIDNKAYVGFGWDANYSDRSDFQVFDVNAGYWTKLTAPFPGEARGDAVAFSLNGKGYVGTGYNRTSDTLLSDFWEYDPVTDSWKRLNDFGGGVRLGAVAFVDEVYGYVGTGIDTRNYSTFGDFWQYNPLEDTWKEIPSFDGAVRALAMVMNINDRVYIMGGVVSGGGSTSDIWRFDPALLEAGRNPWTNRSPSTSDAQFENFKTATSRYGAVTFALNGKGYIATGTNGSYLGTNFQYDPSANTWIEMAPFQSSTRSEAVAFVVADQQNVLRAFVTGGNNGSLRFEDIWEFNFEQ